MNDNDAMHRLKHGGISGLEHLVLRYQVKAIRAAFLITRDEHHAYRKKTCRIPVVVSLWRKNVVRNA